MTGVDHIRCRLGTARGHKGIYTVGSTTLVLHQFPAVGPLANRLIGGGQVHDHLRTGKGQQVGRGQGRPQILANLHANKRPIPDPEQQVLTDGHAFAYAPQQSADVHGVLPKIVAGGKPAFFVEFIVIGDAGLGDDALDSAPGDDNGAVEHLRAQPQRQAHHSDHIGAQPRAVQYLPQALLHPFIQGVLIEEVLAGVAGKGHLREHQQVHLLGVRLSQKVTNIPGIFLGVANLHPGYGAGDANIIQHGKPSLFSMVLS